MGACHSDVTEEEEKEKLRQDDIRERDAFAERLKEKSRQQKVETFPPILIFPQRV